MVFHGYRLQTRPRVEGKGSRPLTLAIATVAVGLTTGCSVWNDTTDWVSGIFSDEPAPAPQGATTAGRGSNSLGTVPARPTAQSTDVERQLAQNSLAADRENARYTDDELRGRPSQSSSPPPAPAPVQSTVASAAPRAAAPQPQRQTAAVPQAVPQQGAQVAAAPQVQYIPMQQTPNQTVGGAFAAQLQASGAPTLAQAGLGNLTVGDGSAQFIRSTAPAMPVTFMGTPGFTQPTATVGGNFGPTRFADGFGGGMAAGPRGGQFAVVRFENGSAGLDQADRNELARVADAYRQQGGRVRVVGHSSSRTRDMSIPRHQQVNADVSRRRAEAVRAELVRRGVRGDAIVVEARGDNELVYYEAMPRAEAFNRRVEIFLEN